MPAAAPGQQVVVVTGCTAGGIGWHLCAALAARGALVFATARRVAAMEGLAERGCRLVQLDVTQPASVTAAVAQIIKDAGRIDVLVNNAGVAIRKPTADFKLDEVRYLFDVNYFGLVAMTDAVLPHMLERRAGKIFHVGSALGYNALPCMGHYSATKYAVRAYADMQRVELAPFGIKVCYVAPGYVRTHIADSDHDLPADSIYRAFPRLVNELTRTVFSGTTWERATPVERFAPGLAAAVLAKSPPRHYAAGHLWWFPWLMNQDVPLFFHDWGFALWFGLMPNSMVSRPVLSKAS